MDQRIVRTRVRPARVAVLIDRDGTPNDFVLAIRFLSRLWGGMFAPIFPTSPSPRDALTEFRLAEARPDYVYAIGLNVDAWKSRVQDACQPRGFGLLDESSPDVLYAADTPEELITDRHLLNFLYAQSTGGRQRVTRVIPWDESSALFPLVVALLGFGRHVNPNPAVPIAYGARVEVEPDYRALIATHRAMVENFERSWLELTYQKLSLVMRSAGFGHPTIVLVEDSVQDLALFWNLRMEGRESVPRWIIPVPASMGREEEDAAYLREWILAFSIYNIRQNYVFIRSQTVSMERRKEFAEWLQPYLRETPVKFVDAYPAPNRLPVVTPYESEKLVEVRRAGRRATWLRPQSKVAESFGFGASWMVDLVDEPRTGRAPFELFLPPTTLTMEVLNAPSPPSVTDARIDYFGFGVDSINVWCDRREEFVSHWLPTAEEVLEEWFNQHGFVPKVDEKRASYFPALKLLGGLREASVTLCGVRWSILQELGKAPASVEQLKSQLQLGGGEIPELTEATNLEFLLDGLSPVRARVGRQRLLKSWGRTLPKESRLESLLEHWVSCSILRRVWRVRRCPVCQTTHREASLRITKPYRCPGCGSNIPLLPLAASLKVEYELHPILKAALDHGFRSVALTGQFLRNLTRHGYLWLPGLKYGRNEIQGDVDLVASCDGRLVLAECKTRQKSDASTVDWPSTVAQVRALAEVGTACNAGSVLLASMIEDYPPEVVREVEALSTAALRVRLLNKQDLESGFRWVKDNEPTPRRPLTLDDLLPEPFPEVAFPVFEEPREVDHGGIRSSISPRGFRPGSQ